jgi:hypothetical protein
MLGFEGAMMRQLWESYRLYTETYNSCYTIISVWAITQFAIILLSPMPLIYRVVTDKRSAVNLCERIRRDVLLKLNFDLLMLGCMVTWIVISMIPILTYKDQRVQTSFVIIRQFFFRMFFMITA